MVRPVRLRSAGGLLAISRKKVQIDTFCLDCGEPIHLEMKDGKILNCDPAEGIVGYTCLPFKQWFDNMSYA